MIRLKFSKKTLLVLLIIGVAISLILISYGTPLSEFRADSLWGNDENGSYDLAFLELTERGNLFHRERLIELEAHVKQQSNNLMIVFIHGWRHNARLEKRSFKRYQSRKYDRQQTANSGYSQMRG